MKAQLLTAVAFIVLLSAGFIISCADSSDDDENDDQEGPDAGESLGDSVALFGYSDDGNQFFLRPITSTPGPQIMRGAWAPHGEVYVMTNFTVGGKQYLMAIGGENLDYNITEIYPTGDMGADTDIGQWGNDTRLLLGLVDGDQTYVYAGYGDGVSWVVREIESGGKLGEITDSGIWPRAYGPGTTLALSSNRPCFFIESLEGNVYQTVCLYDNGKLMTLGAGNFDNLYPTMASFTRGGRNFLFIHREDSETGKGPWAIWEVSDGGVVGEKTDSNEWNHFYQNVTIFSDPTSGGVNYLVGQEAEDANNIFFIQKLSAQGTMMEQTYSSTLDHFYKFFLPFAFDSTYASYDSWMKQQNSIIGDRNLTQIAIPGSHDAGMNEADKGDCWVGFSCNTVTQQGDIAFQLSRGSRYFDIRPVFEETDDGTGNWRTGHTDIEDGELIGCKGEDKDSIVSAINDFFADTLHEYELVILKISHCAMRSSGAYYGCDSSGNQGIQYSRLNFMVNDLYDQLQPSGVVACSTPNLATMTINEILKLGHVILLVDNSGLDDETLDLARGPSDGVFRWKTDFYIHDDYSNSEDYYTMETDQTGQLLNPDNHEYNGKRMPFLLSWTLTLNVTDAVECKAETNVSILDLALQAQPHLYEYLILLNRFGYLTQTLFPNILYLDDFNGTGTRSAIYLNEQYANLPAE